MHAYSTDLLPARSVPPGARGTPTPTAPTDKHTCHSLITLNHFCYGKIIFTVRHYTTQAILCTFVHYIHTHNLLIQQQPWLTLKNPPPPGLHTSTSKLQFLCLFSHISLDLPLKKHHSSNPTVLGEHATPSSFHQHSSQCTPCPEGGWWMSAAWAGSSSVGEMERWGLSGSGASIHLSWGINSHVLSWVGRSEGFINHAESYSNFPVKHVSMRKCQFITRKNVLRVWAFI